MGAKRKAKTPTQHHHPNHKELHAHLAKNSWLPPPSPDALARTNLELGDHFRIQRRRKQRDRVKKTESLWCASVEMLRLAPRKASLLNAVVPGAFFSGGSREATPPGGEWSCFEVSNEMKLFDKLPSLDQEGAS